MPGKAVAVRLPDATFVAMRTASLGWLILLLVLGAVGCRSRKEVPPAPAPVAKRTMQDYNRPLAPGEAALMPGDLGQVPAITLAQRPALLAAVGRSLAWLGRKESEQQYPVSGISHEQVLRSLQALADLLRSGVDDAAFDAALRSRFQVLQSVGFDRRGTVLFTGYYTPIFTASLTRTAEFQYPIFLRPDDLVPAQRNSQEPAQQRLPDGTTRPYPTRAELIASGALRGHELVWFADPYEAYIVEIQGSAKLHLTSGHLLEVGNSGTNNYPYHAIGLDLVKEGKIAREDLSLATIRAYFHAHPAELPEYLARNPRVAFCRQVSGGPFGKLGVPVTTDISVATDKSIFPPGAACITVVPSGATIRLDQDSGGAIRAAGRCDFYMGEGDSAEARAGSQFAEGQLYYLLLK